MPDPFLVSRILTLGDLVQGVLLALLALAVAVFLSQYVVPADS